MEIQLTPEQEERLSQIAQHDGINANQLVTNAALRLVEGDERFRAAVREGIAAADRGDLIDDAEVLNWLEGREHS